MIPTAEEFFNKNFPKISVIEVMKKFAEIHTAKALKEASVKAKLETLSPWEEDEGVFRDIDRESILNSYPLSNIK